MEEQNIISETIKDNKPSALHQVTPFSKYLTMALFITLPFVGGYVGYTFAPEKIVEVERVVTKEVEVEKVVEVPVRAENTDADLLVYVDNEVGIAFEYPVAWGMVSVDDEPGQCPVSYTADVCNFRTVSLKDIYSGAIFISAETKGHHDYPPGRGAFWGDAAGMIGANYLTQCAAADDCETVLNANGVSFALYEADPPPEEMGYQPERYYVYNPNSEYYGLVLSPHRLDSPVSDISQIFKETVIETFRFIE